MHLQYHRISGNEPVYENHLASEMLMIKNVRIIGTPTINIRRNLFNLFFRIIEPPEFGKGANSITIKADKSILRRPCHNHCQKTKDYIFNLES